MFMPTTVEINQNIIRILIVDDQNFIRKTIQMYLEYESDLEIIGYAENGTTALKQIEELTPDIVILDLEMPDMDGLTTIQMIRDRFSQTKILVLSSHDERENINRAIEAGAKGYLIKGTPARELANAVRSISQGYFQLGPGLMEKLVISMSSTVRNNSKTLEEKLIIALKKFKYDTNDQLEKLVTTRLEGVEQRWDGDLEIKLLNFKKKNSQLYEYIRGIEFKLYLSIMLQVLFLFVLAAHWVMNYS
jgi:DNA-binding NarL/FixJ family response regulator